MILTGQEIKKRRLSHLHIKPFIEDHVNPNSYNYRLGTKLLMITDSVIDPRKPMEFKEIHLTDKGYILRPGRLYLGNTFEEIGSDHYVTSLIGRSSLGRLGLFLQITADLGQLGAKHCWTLEMKVVQPLRIYPMMKIGQVTFWKPEGKRNLKYNGKYAKHSDPHISELFSEF
jgi:dCTP deaminase